MTYMTFQECVMRAQALHKRGTEMLQARDESGRQLVEQAVGFYQSALNVDMDNPGINFMLGTCYLQLGCNALAAILFEKAVALKPDFHEAFCNLGAAYRNEHRNDKAQSAYLRGLEIKEDADFYANLAALAVNEGRPEKGIPYAERCIQVDPGHVHGNWNLALLYLEAGRYQEGFDQYDWGFRSGDRVEKQYSEMPDLPLWDGSPGKRVIVWGEQGLGDEILFAGFLPAMARDCEVIFDCHPRLEGAWRRSFGDRLLGVHGTRKTLETPWLADYDRVDAKVAIASIAKHYWKTRREAVPYLVPDEVLVDDMRRLLADAAASMGKAELPKVGIAWMGGGKKTRADLRSVGLDALKPLLGKAALWVSLQYTEEARGEVTRLRQDGETHLLHFDPVVREFDYDANLALMGALDLVICVNTTAAHACGAMNRDCWTMTPHGKAWRYGAGKATLMPWYKSVRQFHQHSDAKDWNEVLVRVGKEFDMWRK